MRKNRMMRAASALMVAVLLTTSTISGTFAKYVTTSEAKDEARVAKWGVELQVVGNLFGDSYANAANGNKIVDNGSSDVTVQSFNQSDDVVAPGTMNADGFRISLKGKPEVDGIITSELKVQDIFLKANTYGVMVPVDGTVINEDNFDEFTEDDKLYYFESNEYKKASSWVAGKSYYTLEDSVKIDTDYYPVVYDLAGNTSANGNLDAIVNALGARLAFGVPTEDTDTTKTYQGSVSFESNTVLENTYFLEDITLTWVWAFYNDDVKDGADTILGMIESVSDGVVVKLSAGDIYVAVEEYVDYCIDAKFDLEITVTQVD